MNELREITREELDMILLKHKRWLDTDGQEGERADLRKTDLGCFDLAKVNLTGADLNGANLVGAVLQYANLTSTNLTGATLLRTNLHGANLTGADLRCADLYCADLTGAYLPGANLKGADLGWTRLFHADLTGANLSAADLKYANLWHANLEGVNLLGADLEGANLTHTNLTDVKNFPDIPLECPETVSFIGWKHAGNYIVKLEIPADAKRSSGTSKKCRCDKAKVLAIENKDGTPTDVTEVHSDYDLNFIYRIGETVIVDDFDDNRFNECAPGIHFYMDRDRAVRY